MPPYGINEAPLTKYHGHDMDILLYTFYNVVIAPWERQRRLYGNIISETSKMGGPEESPDKPEGA